MTSAVSELLVIAVDDTDVDGSGGTGALARALAEHLVAGGLGTSLGVTRHQLLDDAKLPVTEDNLAFAIALQSDRSINDVEDEAVRFVRDHAERDADPGVAVMSRHSDMPHVLAFGRRCQQEVMKLADAERFATEANVRLRALGAKRNGTIGALAAAGLRAGGGDGRYVALRGVRELAGRMTAGQVREATAIAKILDEESDEDLDRDDVIDTLDWIRPRLVDGQPLLLTRRSPDDRKLWLPVDRRSEATEV